MAELTRIAIVNRGDAALRAVRAIKELRAEEGSRLTAIAIYTDPDRSAPFVRLADEALSLGPALRGARGAPPRPAYLDRARVLAALRATHADAVWPGWGFVAEDPAFVELLEARGITFLGPSSATMHRLGDKIAAKQLAERAQVPVAAWSGGAVAAEGLHAAAAHIGFPLLIKASAGGGGRGIRIVRDAAALDAAFASATAEATHAFGDGRVFLEQLVPQGRHIEVQIAADRTGHCLAVGLRDCSLQRRHQKIIEEAPPPDLAATVASALRDAAVRLAQAAGYVGVGTVEFLLGPDGRSAYFLEVNPRLQVEHGLSEALTGIDLVHWQIRIARGERLPAAPPPERGHAIEARVCAEDLDAGFTPTPGTVVRLDLPSGPGLRVDCGVALGSTIPAEFDSLIAKVIAHGPTREAARARLACALADFRLVVAGGATNKGALLALLDHPDVRRGGVDVAWLERRGDLPSPPHAAQALMVAAILSYLEERSTARLNFFLEAASGHPRSVPPSTGQSLDFTYRGAAYRVGVLALGEWRYRIQLDGRECVATLLDQEAHACQLVVGDERFAVTYVANDGHLRIEVDGHPHTIGRDTGGQVRASAPSVVITLDVARGDRVVAGQRLGLLETMKIEIAFTAPITGVVREICVQPNERVAAGAVLLVLQPEAAAAAAAGEQPRVVLPAWDDPLHWLSGGDGQPTLAPCAHRDVTVRERVLDALHDGIRRVLLGFDAAAGDAARFGRLLHAPLPFRAPARVLEELAVLRSAVEVFADVEVLFSRAPDEGPDGTLGPSNEARLRLYLRRIGIQGAGMAAPFLARLRRALAHYGLADLTPGEALERALFRLYATRQHDETRAQLVAAVIRLLVRLAEAGVDLSGERGLEAALTTCMVLRGQIGDALADAAAEARAAIFELPRLRAQAAAATSAVETWLHDLGGVPSEARDLELLGRIADSPAAIFDRIATWTAEGDAARRDLAVQVLVLRRYAPHIPTDCRLVQFGEFRLSRLAFPNGDVVLAAVLPAQELTGAWDAVRAAAVAEPAPPFVELMLPMPRRTTLEALRRRLTPRLRQHPPKARRVCLTALQPDGRRLHLAYEWSTGGAFAERGDLFGLHPETARRLELDRLAEFDLERLPSPDGVYAFFGHSRRIPDDERIFVLAEARAALPGIRGTLHEPAFVHTFHQAVHTLRNIRAERDRRGRLHWNRITIFLRPPLVLPPAVVHRLARELTPAARHLGLEKVVVRLALREARDAEPRATELTIEPSSGGRSDVVGREPHHAPLRPATRYERRLAQARRRGLAHPYEVIDLFTRGGLAPGEFEEFDLDPRAREPVALSVRGRPPDSAECGVVFGLIRTPTAKHPEGMLRVLIVSDPTHDMGALAAPECDRIVAALDLAAARSVPAEWVAVSSGARIAMDSGTENLDATARVVRRIVTFTEAGGEINVIVPGVNVGAQSYFDALATMLLHTRGILVMTPGAAMVLTGRRALEASGGVAAEDEVGIGGFERIMGPSGQAQYYARDLADAHAILLEHYRHTYVAPGEAGPRRHATTDPIDRAITLAPYPDTGEGFATVGEIFAATGNPDRKRPFAMRPVMQAVIDRDAGHLERWAHMVGAETAIVWDAHLGGHPVCVIGVESRNVPRLGYRPQDGPDTWTGGTLFPLSSKKVARALNAASGNRPVVVLANLSGFDGSPESMRKLQLEYGAEIARAVVNFHGPILFVVVSRYHGGAYVVFSRALNDDLYALALEGSFASVIGGGPAATVVFAREVDARTNADPRVVELRERVRRERHPRALAALRDELERVTAAVALEHHSAIAREFDATHSVERARAVGSLDAIIPATALRAALVGHLDAAWHRRQHAGAPPEPRTARG